MVTIVCRSPIHRYVAYHQPQVGYKELKPSLLSFILGDLFISRGVRFSTSCWALLISPLHILPSTVTGNALILSDPLNNHPAPFFLQVEATLPLGLSRRGRSTIASEANFTFERPQTCQYVRLFCTN